MSLSVLLTAGCAGPPQIMNRTPPSAPRSASGSHEFSWDLDPGPHRIESVATRIRGVEWRMTAIPPDPGMLPPRRDQYSGTADLGLCTMTIPGSRVDH